MENTNKEWRDVKGYEGQYMVSSSSEIKSLDRINPLNRFLKGKPRKISITKGYNVITLSKMGKYKTHKLHRLVAEAFIPNPKNKPQVNHVDGNKLNNHVSNLEWATASENIKHSHEKGLQKIVHGDKHHFSKLTEKNVVEIKRMGLEKTKTQKEIAVIFGIWPQTVGAILNGKKWKHVKL